MIVEGAIVDVDGARAGYVRFDGAAVAEVGQIGTDSSHGRDRRVRGIVVPAPVNGHIHLGDSVSTREPPPGPLERLVGPPDGWKFQLLRNATAAAKRRAITAAVARMGREGIGAAIDFREEGVEGMRTLRAAVRRTPLRVAALGRPLRRPIEAAELDEVLALADGIGLSSAREESREDRQTVERACRASGKLFGMHASENVREDPEAYLAPRPDLLVHLTEATDDDLARVAKEAVTVAVCPRSNALFGRRPRLAALERLGVRTILGTDNVMFHAPSIWRELEFAYVSSRLAGETVSPAFLVRSVFVEPWRLLGQPGQAKIEPGGPARPIVVRLPADDPAYQLVGRATEHLIVRPGSSGRGSTGR